MPGLSDSAAAAARFCPICGVQTDAEVCPSDGVPTVRADFDAPDDPAIGRLIAGRFRVERFVGQGGTGRVYAATQLSIGREVALKLLQPHHVRDRKQVRRFYREARAATRLTSPHVVKVFDFGVDDDTRTPFIAMELLNGETLAELLARQGAFTPGAAARIGAQIARALAEAGDAGIVHRDLKPANIVMVDAGDGTGIAKVADFGVAKDLVREDTEQLTQQGAAIGTPAYMAPEQVSGATVSAQTDLYALGCILYELMSLRRPFDGEASAALLVDHLLRPAPPLPDPLPTGAPLPPALGDLLARLLAKSPADRPESAKAVALALDAISEDRPYTLGSGQGAAALARPAAASAGAAPRATTPGPGTQTDDEPAADAPWALPAAAPSPVAATAAPDLDAPGELPVGGPPWRTPGAIVWLFSSAVAVVVAVVLFKLVTGGDDVPKVAVGEQAAEASPGDPAPERATQGASGEVGPAVDLGAAGDARGATGRDRAALTPRPRRTRRSNPADLARPARRATPDEEADRAARTPVDRSGPFGLPPGPLDIDALTVRGGAARILLHDGPAQVLTVEGDGTRVAGELDGSTLSLAIAVGADPVGAAPLVVHVWAPDWTKVRVTGSSTVVTDGVLEVDALSVALSGSARAALDVNGADLTLSLRGSADVTLRGAVDRLDVRMGGASRLEASALEADEVSLAASGTSEALVHPMTSLDARNDGTGEITYLGRPAELTQDGAGIRPRDRP